MRAQVGIFSHWTSDINIFTISNMKLVNLWHGPPLKKIGRDDIIRIKSLSKIKKIGIKLFPFLTKGFSGGIMIAASPRVRKTFSMAFDMSESNVKVTGYPRNDIFFMKHTEDYPFKSKLEKLQKSYKVGIYLPTHRKKDEQNPTPLFKGYKDYLNSKLKEKKVILLYKYHYFRQKQFENETSGYSNIIILKDDDINQDIYLVLSQVDFLITDYSSAYFDFLLTDKPIIFTPFDIEYYLKYERGFYYKYEEVTPGPIAKTWDELLKYIDDVIKYPDKYKKQREIIRKQFNQYNNGNSSQRVFNEIINSIKNVDHLL